MDVPLLLKGSSPALVEKATKDGIQTLHGRNNEILNSWGVTLNNEMVELEARILPPPTLIFGDGFSSTSPAVSWNPTLFEPSRKFSSSSSLISWSIAVFGEPQNCDLAQIDKFGKILQATMQGKGMVS